MENDSSKLVDDLEKGDDFLNEIIESNREMDSLLLESDFALETAESELKATIKDLPSIISDDETSSALSIEVSEDLFKGFTSDINFSPLRYASDKVKDTKFKEHGSVNTPSNLNNLLDDFNATLKCYNDVFQQDNITICNELNKIIDENNKTIISDSQHDQENSQSSGKSKEVNIKSLVSLDSEEEHDYLYVDFFNTTLEITVPNNANENLNNSSTTTKLKHQNYFEGCSEEFDFKTIGNEFTIIVNTEVNKTIAENNSYKPIKTDSEDPVTFQNLIPVELNDLVEKIAEPIKSDNEFANDDINISFDHIRLDPTDIVDITETSKISTEITSGDMSKTFRNFIQSELNIDTTSEENVENDLSNNTESVNTCVPLHNNNEEESNTLKITETTLVEIKIVEEISLNENNNIVPQNLKRPAEDATTCENEPKKQKLYEKPATVTKETILKTDEINIVPEEINFTQAIFDHEETADNNDPKWSVLKDLETNEDYFKSVRTQWRSLSLPNPHKNNTTRYVHENIANIKPQTVTSSENERATSCSHYLEKRIQNMTNEMNALYSKLNRFPRFKSRSERHRLNNDLDQLRNLQHEVEKNKEELKHINMFYYNDAQGWNANYLNRSELTELKEQDQVLNFQKKFYT